LHLQAYFFSGNSIGLLIIRVLGDDDFTTLIEAILLGSISPIKDFAPRRAPELLPCDALLKPTGSLALASFNLVRSCGVVLISSVGGKID
jgi:hypothetical protein